MRILAGTILAILCAAAPVTGVAEQDDFTFRRIKVGGEAGKRITVQIDPEEQARRLAASSTRMSKRRPMSPARSNATRPMHSVHSAKLVTRSR